MSANDELEQEIAETLARMPRAMREHLQRQEFRIAPQAPAKFVEDDLAEFEARTFRPDLAEPRLVNGAMPIECLRAYRQLLDAGLTDEAHQYLRDLYSEQGRAESEPPAERGEDD